MLNAKKLKRACLVLVALMVLATLVTCLASCGAEATGIEFKAGSCKTTYEVGDTFDVTGAKIVVTYSDKSTVEVDVTRDMVTVDAFLTEGTKTATIAYTVEGKKLTTTFEITVNNSLASAIAAAKTTVNGLEGAKDHVELLGNCISQLNAAKTTAEVDAIVAAFKTDLAAALAKDAELAKALADAKTAAIAEVNGRDLSKVSSTLREFAESLKAAAIENINNALDVAIVNQLKEGYLGAIEGFEKTSIKIDDDNENSHKEEIAKLANELRIANDAIQNDIWYSAEAKSLSSTKVFLAQAKLYVTLNLDVAKEIVDDTKEELERIPNLLDDVYYATVRIGYVHYTDPSDDLIEDAEVRRQKCFDVDAALAAQELAKYFVEEYKYPKNDAGELDSFKMEGLRKYSDATETDKLVVDLLTLIDHARARYDELGEATYEAYYGDDTVTPAIPSLIDAIKNLGYSDNAEDNLVNVDSLDDIKAAYALYLSWAEKYRIIDKTKVDTASDDYNTYKDLLAKYEFTLYEGTDMNDKDVIVYNYYDIFKALETYDKAKESLEEDLKDLKDAIDAIGKVLIGVVDPIKDEAGEIKIDTEYRDAEKTVLVDSDAAIAKAEELLDAFKANNAYNYAANKDSYFKVDGKDYEQILIDARARYDELKQDMEVLTTMIGRLANELDKLNSSDEATLQDIAAKYDAFKAKNTLDEVSFTGVIYNYEYYLAARVKLNYILFTEKQTEVVANLKAELAALIAANPEKADELTAVEFQYNTELTQAAYDDAKTLADNLAVLTGLYDTAVAKMNEVIA